MRRNQIICVTFTLILLVCTACVNTPPQVMKLHTQAAATMIAGIDQTQTAMADDASSDQEVIQRPDDMITQGSGGTSTPIVLQPEQRGATQSIIQVATQAVSAANTVAMAATASSADKVTVSNYSPASGSVVMPNEAFHLDITLYNAGTTTWQTTYQVIDYSDSSLAIEKTHSLPNPVAPGGTTVISIYMTAPAGVGSYNSNFYIQDAYGVPFGYFDYVLTVGEYSSITSIPTLTATITPTYYSAEGITATPSGYVWNCIDRERSKNLDCYEFCLAYAADFPECYHHGEQVQTPVP